jgi:hypothetical protein
MGKAKGRERGLQLGIVRRSSLQRVRKSDGPRRSSGGVLGRALLRHRDLRARGGLARLSGSAPSHQEEKRLDQERPDNRGSSHSGVARFRISHTLQHLASCTNHCGRIWQIPRPDRGSVEAITYIHRVTRFRLKRSERRIKLCSESVGSKRWLGQVIFRNIEERQLHCEATAMAFFAGNLDFSAMGRADGLHDGQAQSCPAGVA